MRSSLDDRQVPADERRAGAAVTMRGCPRGARGAASPGRLAVVLIVVAVVAAAAWWFFSARGGLPTIAKPGPATSATAPGTTAAPSPVATDDLTVDQLYKEARVAMGENRMVAPAGNNALEYYLKILARQPDDSGATDALRELFPFATGSAEEQINQGDFDEATRIMNLLAKADPSNYTLTILRSKLDAKKKQVDRDQQQATAAAAAAAAAARTQAAAANAPPTAESAAAVPPPETPATPAPKPVVAKATPAPVAAPPPAPAAPVGETRDARVVTPPRPAYPAAAARNRQDGWVEVEFTVAADGSVQGAKVVNANPSRTFDNAALSAIKQAKFDPRLVNGQPVASTLRRRIEFKLGQ